MREKFLTVLVVPHDERNVKRWRISYGWLKLMAFGGLLAGLLIAVAVLTYGRVAARATRAAVLEIENARLEAEKEKVDQIVANLERTERAYTQIREMAGLPAVDETEDEAPTERPTMPGRPTGWPLSVKGFVTAEFGDESDHPGVDIAVPTSTPVLATAEGVVSETGDDPVYGNYLVIDHEDELQTMYGHNETILVEAGDRVVRGATIAYSGNSGRSSAPHLHYEIRQEGEPVDPTPYLR